METTILTKKNCHRAATIRPVGDTDCSENVYSFDYRAIKKNESFLHCTYAHEARKPDGTKVEITDHDLKNWAVVEWHYAENLEDLYDAGVRAFSATSHTPEDRALQYIREYEKEIQEDLGILPENEREPYFAKYREWVTTLFSRHSRIMSAMIVGPAKFPTSRNNNANDAYNQAYQDFRQWRDNFFRGVQRRIEAAKSPEERAEDEFKAIRRSIIESATTIFLHDTKGAPVYRSLIVSNLYNRMETLAKNGKVEMLRRASALIKELNEKFKKEGGKEVFTSRHKFWKLVEQAEAQIAKQQEMEGKEDKEIEFDGGNIVFNYAENRLQIFHDSKPDYDVISLLKKEGWRWSRNNGCWQRQLTPNACYSAARVIKGGKTGVENLETTTQFAKQLCTVLHE